MPKRDLAVIGGGVAGLTAARELSKHHRVTLFEADSRLSGHAHTHRLEDGAGGTVAVDSAFLVHNDRTYPTLCRLFDELGVRTRDTDMSMSVRCEATCLEYAGARSILGLFPTICNLTRPRYLAMLAEVKTFHWAATRLLQDEDAADDNRSLREFLAQQKFSPFFTGYFMTPLVAAMWSAPPAAALDYPARYLFTFLEHHGTLTVFGSPVWRTVVGADGRTPVNWSNLVLLSAVSLAAMVVLFGATFLIGRRIGRYNVVDVTWGLAFVVVAAISAVLGDGDPTRRILLLALVSVWGLRLALHLAVKLRGKGEDPRYEAHLGDDFSTATVLRKIFIVQGAAAWFVSLPLQVSAASGPTPAALLPVLGVGVALWLVGLVFEALGDHQLKAFKADPTNKGKIMDRGLWSWTRHPNYFGDACLWWGLWLITLFGWAALTTLLSPVLMTYFLVYATGARVAEKHMAGRPGFQEYCERTAFFIPRPPRRHR